MPGRGFTRCAIEVSGARWKADAGDKSSFEENSPLQIAVHNSEEDLEKQIDGVD